MKLQLLAASGLVLMAACATTAPETDLPPPDPVPVVMEQSAAERAMDTANGLAAAGNPQAAIDRLTQALGSPQLSDAEKAELYKLRGDIRLEAGDDTWGAIDDFETVLELVPGTETAILAEEQLGIARGKATSLNFQLETGGLTRSQRFETLWELGEHDDALDLLRQGGVNAEPDTLLAMFQIGYLCEGDEFAGQEFSITEPDGTPRTVRFCDTGK
jgi:tetratricopeptide (TPR) repeat protein